MGMNVQLEDGPATADEGDGASENVVAEINITPLTDVFLVLLIIFMVTSTALVETEAASKAGMKVVLPKANAAGPVSQRRSDPVLTVTRGNELYLGSKKVDPGNLEGEIRKALHGYPEITCVHLFMAVPVGLAMMIGQLLNNVPSVQTYELVADDGGKVYRPAVRLRPSI